MEESQRGTEHEFPVRHHLAFTEATLKSDNPKCGPYSKSREEGSASPSSSGGDESQDGYHHMSSLLKDESEEEYDSPTTAEDRSEMGNDGFQQSGMVRSNSPHITEKKIKLESRKIGRPRLDRSHTACYCCNARQTSQWRYLEARVPSHDRARPPQDSFSVQDLRSTDLARLCVCNACWLRVTKLWRKRRTCSCKPRTSCLHLQVMVPLILDEICSAMIPNNSSPTSRGADVGATGYQNEGGYGPNDRGTKRRPIDVSKYSSSYVISSSEHVSTDPVTGPDGWANSGRHRQSCMKVKGEDNANMEGGKNGQESDLEIEAIVSRFVAAANKAVVSLSNIDSTVDRCGWHERQSASPSGHPTRCNLQVGGKYPR
eukprot:GHVO01046569.1.p1 GENE.GHVO01046569.1~~GHVO01046569.1.p1  ORF type:complete len:372 (+),score=45.92 GHVO01046569.1:50-1165(+)